MSTTVVRSTSHLPVHTVDRQLVRAGTSIVLGRKIIAYAPPILSLTAVRASGFSTTTFEARTDSKLNSYKNVFYCCRKSRRAACNVQATCSAVLLLLLYHWVLCFSPSIVPAVHFSVHWISSGAVLPLLLQTFHPRLEKRKTEQARFCEPLLARKQSFDLL